MSDHIAVTGTVVGVGYCLYKNPAVRHTVAFEPWNQTEGALRHVDAKSGGLDIGRLRGIEVLQWPHVLIVNEPRPFDNGPSRGNPAPGKKSQPRSDMSRAARRAANQKFNASRDSPQVLAICKDAG